MPRAGKRQLTFWLSDDAYEGLRAYASEQGTSVTALVEALGLHLAETASPPRWPALLRAARLIDADRRRRT